MKAFVFLVASFFALTFANAQKPEKKAYNELFLSVNMDCKSCETKIADQLKFEKGVRDLKCDFSSNTVYVKYKEGSNTDEKFIKRIEKMEYKVVVISKEEYDAKLKP